MHRKFNDDIFARCLVIMKMLLSHAWVWKPRDLGRGIQSCGYHGP